MLASSGATAGGEGMTVPYRAVETQPAELFSLGDFTRYWNTDWTLTRAGFGGISVGACQRGTFLDGEVLATWPRDESRGVLLRRVIKLGSAPRLDLEVAADHGCAWRIDIFVNNTNILGRLIEGKGPSGQGSWEAISVDLAAFRGQEVELRIYQRTLLAGRVAGNAYWRNLRVR